MEYMPYNIDILSKFAIRKIVGEDEMDSDHYFITDDIVIEGSEYNSKYVKLFNTEQDAKEYIKNVLING